MSQILIVEDEPRIAAFIAKGLKSAGFTSLVESSGVAAVQLALAGDIDLVILDIGLPDIDGFEVLSRLRGQGVTIPVIMLTARSSVADTVAGLESGADDYMPKPFRFDELLARIHLRLRSDAGGSDAGPMVLVPRRPEPRPADPSRRGGRTEGRPDGAGVHPCGDVPAQPRPCAEPRAAAVGAWGYDFEPGSNVVDVYVRYLRRKLGAEFFETVRGWATACV